MFWQISDGVKAIARQMIDHPEDWEQRKYYFENLKHTDIKIWTANGTSFINLEGNDCFTRAEKVCIADAIKKSIAARIRKG